MHLMVVLNIKFIITKIFRMSKTLLAKKAPPEQVMLYTLLGEAVCMIQHLEDALSHAIVLKKEVKTPNRIPKMKGNRLLAKHQRNTLGDGIKIAKEYKLFSKEIEAALEDLKEERNWLVHRSISRRPIAEEKISEELMNKLWQRFKQISIKAHILIKALEEDVIKFSEDQGLDMSHIRKETQQHYS